MRVRQNVYKLPAGDTTLEWYEKAVAVMIKRKTTDVTSWNYQAAMHGFVAQSPYWKNANPLPSNADQKEYWSQCQHQNYFFLPWHRMYLAYFEQIVAQIIVDLGGPAGWSLPFWDYSDPLNPNALKMPDAFTTPSDISNSLWISGRVHLILDDKSISIDGAMQSPIFIGLEAPTGVSGFGGPKELPGHSGKDFGELENTPHGLVHSRIGGAMGSPETAGLDPIFWLHHANIDRLWQVWLNQGKRANPTESAWLSSPFQFFDKNGKLVEMSAVDVLDTQKVLDGYTYQGVPSGLPTTQQAQSFAKLDFTMPLEVVAATNRRIDLNSQTTMVALKLTPSRRKQESFTTIRESLDVPKTTVLKLENVKGKGAPPTQHIYLNVPDKVIDTEAFYAGSISLFGIENSSTPNLHHPGSGQNYTLNVTDLMNKLRSLPNWDEKQLTISIVPAWPMSQDCSVSIGRISLYSE